VESRVDHHPRFGAARAWRGLALLALVVLAVSCRASPPAGARPAARDGTIDLSHWNFYEDGPADLRGAWRLDWSHDDPSFAGVDFDDSGWQTVDSQKGFGGKVGSRFGLVWMRLLILLPQRPASAAPLAMDLLPFNSASEVYVDGARWFAAGQVAGARDQYRPDLMPHMAPISLNRGQREMVIAVRGANFDRLIGGMTDSPRLGSLDQLQSQIWRTNLWNTLVIGVYILLILYHVFFFLGRREDLSPLYFALFCTGILMRMATLNFFLERTFPNLDVFALRFKLEYMGPTLGVLALAFFGVLFPQEFSPRVVRISRIVVLVEFLYPVFVPLSLFSAALPVYQMSIALALLSFGAFVMVGVVRAVIHRRQGSWIVSVGFVLLFAGVINDVFHDWGFNTASNMVQHGGLAFILLNAIVLANRSATAFRTAEHLSTNLQHEVEAKTRELKKKNVQLQELDRQKTTLFQNISHEFRTPLTLILGPLTASLGTDGGRFTPVSFDQTQIMLRNSQRLLRLINQLLDLSKLEAGKMRLKVQAIDLVKMLAQVVAAFESLAARKKIQFDFVHDDEELIIYADLEKIEKVFFNLLSNAFKFTADGGKIRVGVAHDGKEALVRFTDTGQGIPADQLPFIFERFRQADGSSTREFGGTGIGLSLVKEYVDLHGGRVEVESEVNIGATFTIALRLGKEHYEPDDLAADGEAVPLSGEAGAASRAALLPGGEAATTAALAKAELEDTEVAAEPSLAPESAELILIVEDNRDMRAYIKETLRRHFRVQEAGDGEEGLRKAKELRPDLILTDVMMPKMDGYALIRALAEAPETRRIPVIVLTAKASEDMKVEGLLEGAHDFLAKPFNPRELAARIGILLKLVRKEKEVDQLNRHMRENVLKRYLPPSLVEQIISGQTGLEEKPQNLPVTILFTDLEKFTKAAADLRAQEMARMLNEYLDAMIEVIFVYGGTIDKFIGDSVMVIFGAPVVMNPAQQATRAAACAVAMQRAMGKLNAAWKEQELPELRMRIGIHHGPVVVGNFGNQRRLDFTAVGPAVNLASRIESACEPGCAYVSGEVCDYLPSRSFEKAGKFNLKNIDGEIMLYRLLPDANWQEFLDVWNRGGASDSEVIPS
jgi:signal transduction histidine kinase/class 3 adenylate cyclase